MRGMGHLGAAEISGAGHLASGFVGTDTIPAICYLENYYGANVETEEVGGSVDATEHSVMMAGGAEKGQEYATYKRLITEIYPDGILSIVSDTWDLWYVLTDTIPKLKNEILARNGKVVIRPDSGDPVDIICGTELMSNTPVEKGVIELLWETFGGTVNSEGFKELDPHIGAIYGDAITLDRCNQICKRLADKGFASTNMVFGIGSFTYQYNTRDTFGHALKSTHVVIDGIESNIFKDPITDNGVKKSQTGKVAVIIEDGKIVFKDGLTTAQEGWYSGSGKNLLKTIFCNGVAYNLTTLQEIRDRISK
jgi:nicotinamide phosphoribosyltransferase